MTTPTTPTDFILTQRHRLREHTDDEIKWWITSYLNGTVADYQMSAWLMAVCFRGMSPRETATLTRCMVDSGVQIQWEQPDSHGTVPVALTTSTTPIFHDDGTPPVVPRMGWPPLVDKHSTGGIGDKISIVLAPLVAVMGIHVPMMAGRGLGHTGGTIDKLESIPGFRTNLPVSEFQSIVRRVGCSITAASAELCPADRRMYALRDVTGTVSSVPLITASIMSKKIAEHPNSLVLDVKYGPGAFVPTLQEALELASSLIATGERNGLCPTTAFLTRMDHPLGQAVGNWIEVLECVQIMNGWVDDERDMRLSWDVIILIIYQAAQMVLQSGLYPDRTLEQLVQEAKDTLKSGRALPKFVEMVAAQGGDTTVILNTDSYPTPEACSSIDVYAPCDGYLARMDVLQIGKLAVSLGAGRRVASDTIDPCAGIWLRVRPSDRITKGQLLATIYAHHGQDELHGHAQRLLDTMEFVAECCAAPRSIITHRMTKDGIEELQV